MLEMNPRLAFVVSCLVGAGLYFGIKRPIWEVALISVLGFLGLGGGRPTYIALKTLPRDMILISRLLKLLKSIKATKAKGKTITSIFKENVQRHPDKPAILFEDEVWTFKDLDLYSNKVANVFNKLGLQRGDKVAIYMQNRPEYTGVFIGLSKLGIEAPFINCNLTDKSLLHSLEIVGPKAIVYEACVEKPLLDIVSQLEESLQEMLFCVDGDTTSVKRHLLEEEMKDVSDDPPPPLTNVVTDDWACYIYTSGTTGLPKAVPMRHMRFIMLAGIFSNIVRIRHDDVVYVTLPLYHSNGGVVGMGQMLVYGSTVALRRKFSARQFWKDCIKYKCTVFVYIGEVCRYILATPPDPSDTQHQIRLATGNGLRPDIWKEFQERFQIPKICEFYGSTEGNIGFFNIEGKIGSVGYKPVLLGFLLPVYLIEVDPTTGDVVRDKNGHCIQVQSGQCGAMIGKINPREISRRFDGYTNEESTKKKILENVFKKGDKYFNSGDIMTSDEEGYMYFKDRAGDTFRWKGENVSTTEVENVFSSILTDQTDVVVFGVEIPKTDGRAGMAVILSTPEKANVHEIAQTLLSHLPVYAVPIFLRFVNNVDLTGTFKFQKVRYRKEGYNPLVISDDLYVLDCSKKVSERVYIPLTDEIYQHIQDGTIQF